MAAHVLVTASNELGTRKLKKNLAQYGEMLYVHPMHSGYKIHVKN